MNEIGVSRPISDLRAVYTNTALKTLVFFTEKPTDAPKTMFISKDQWVEVGSELRLFCEALIGKSTLSNIHNNCYIALYMYVCIAVRKFLINWSLQVIFVELARNIFSYYSRWVLLKYLRVYMRRDVTTQNLVLLAGYDHVIF